MLKITRAANKEVVFTVSGRLNAENLTELKMLLDSEAGGRRMTLDLRELTLVDYDGVSFLVRCEADNIQLRNCAAYIREWITRERKKIKVSGSSAKQDRSGSIVRLGVENHCRAPASVRGKKEPTCSSPRKHLLTSMPCFIGVKMLRVANPFHACKDSLWRQPCGLRLPAK